jgi:anaerobic ribonucleoside-triphosphate reductase activating protein
MLIHHILPFSRVNGPGPRFVVWVQGCSRSCPGCFNPAAQPSAGGTGYTIDAIIARIPLGAVKGVTLSGGEPFEQPEDLFRLLEAVRSLGLHTLVYTGYSYEELRDTARETLAGIDMLIDGPYRRDIPRRNAWAGSGNQRILCLHEGEVILWADTGPDEAPEGEILIGPAGDIRVTGILSGENFRRRDGRKNILRKLP